ncbi:P-loop containing nucleoside triphosphate hydrolase protein [Mycena leptocephala]|nr:P-loop containing nucleoside triphosphate hydrolase protein [Mycena leptocephala]
MMISFVPSSNSISMLPSEPKIFHGRESELSDILRLFNQITPRISILGAGGMGKTSLARAVIHHTDISAKYQEHRFFVACESAASNVELASLIGAHLGLKSSRDLIQPVVQYFSRSAPSLLILDNLETLWEPAESRGGIEEFLSLLTDVDHLALMVGGKRASLPAKVAWTRPFLPPLQPLEQEAARQTFIDIADNQYNLEEVDKVLSLTDNMPLAISPIANLADSEGSTNVLARWEEEKTSLISEGFDRRSNLDLSISLSMASPRLNSLPHSKDLLSLLSMLPDGLSDAELVQSKLPIDNILACKAALICTSLAYTNEHKQLKALIPIREYVQKVQPPGDHLVWPLLKHFQELLEFYVDTHGTQSSSAIVARISLNMSNIQNLLQNGLPQELKDSIYSICHLNSFSRHIGHRTIPLIGQVHNMLPQLRDHHLEAAFITELFESQRNYQIPNPETLISQYLKHFEQVDDTDLKCMLSNHNS